MKTGTLVKNCLLNIKRLSQDMRGGAAIEYALLVTLIAMVLVVVLQSMGASLDGIFSFIAKALSGAESS